MQDLRETHDELANLARKDALTGLLNRRGFDAAAAEAFAEARSLGRPISALMCDIDAFKALNDQYGHEFGGYRIGECHPNDPTVDQELRRRVWSTRRRRVRGPSTGSGHRGSFYYC